MSDSVIEPANADELRQIVSTEACVLPVGNRTKPSLSSSLDAKLVTLRSFTGITQYEPSEFTFTARAGTPIAELAEALSEKHQYLPFDPMLAGAGATIGGTVAAGLSGPGRMRYGGIRDFLLGVQFLSGDGNVIHAGGKVVKNAAGFDIPKFLVGSMGRFGVMTELTFKVFPRPIAAKTLRVQCETDASAMQRTAVAASSRWELDAIDYRPSDQSVFLRLAAPEDVIASLADEIQSLWGDDVEELARAESFWQSIGELNWIADAPFAVKVPTTPSQIARLRELVAAELIHVSVAGNVAWILLTDSQQVASVDTQLQTMGLKGLVVRGSCDTPRIGQWPQSEIQTAIKSAMDPPSRFPALV